MIIDIQYTDKGPAQVQHVRKLVIVPNSKLTLHFHLSDTLVDVSLSNIRSITVTNN